MSNIRLFKKGDTVEVLRDSSSYFAATVIRSPAKTKNQVFIEYQTLAAANTKPLREHVGANRVRPEPPPEPDRSFNLCEIVDAFHGNGWRRGTIVGLFLNFKYLVLFDGTEEQVEFEKCNLRLHRDWNDGVWTLPLEETRKSSELDMKPRELKLKIKFSGRTSEANFSKGTMMEVTSDEDGHFMSTNEEMTVEHSKLRAHQDWIDGKCAATSMRSSELELNSRERDVKFKMKYGRRTSEAKFSKGTMVEVKSNEEGYQGSWYTAVIVGSTGKDKFLVEYQTLKTEDETEPLREKADASHIRPCPPVIQRLDRFKLFEKVDAWYNEGWWVGLIFGVLDGLKYAVYFWTTNEELEFGHFDMRPHQEWIGGKWVAEFRKKSPKLPLKPRPGKLKTQNGLITLEANYFSKGMKVEVKSDEEGYSDSWYPAVIIGSEGTGKYFVEYRTLKTDNEIELLKEEADAPCMRPCPPVIQRVDPFEPFEEVEAWYNDAWWIGGVCKVLQVSSYAVYIRGTNEVLEFQHSDLRPHQHWTDGKWVVPCRGRKA